MSSHQRQIRHAPEFDQLIPDTTCAITTLKSGGTKIGLENMRDWILKSLSHTTEIAQQLRGNTLEETVQNVHWFVYNHFQYHGDVFMQNLYSPACAWKNRYNGIDCKSYSIIASSILMNLKIAHSLRRIKQPRLKPKIWSHVYVVVDTGKNEKIIDGTINTAIELPYVKKNDLIMYETSLPYQGMMAPEKETSVDYDIILDELYEYGHVSQASIDEIEAAIMGYHANGIHPNLNITENGVYIEETYIPVTFSNTGMNGLFGFVKNIFPRHTIMGKLFGSTNTTAGIRLTGKKKKHQSTTKPTQNYAQQQQLIDAQRQLADSRSAAAALALKEKQQKAASKKKMWIIIGGVLTSVVVIGTVVYVVKK